MDMANGSGLEPVAGVEPNGHGNGGPPDWVPPTTREDADEAILALSNDIGLILAQLAEDQTAWCARTGRSPADYAAWRRRALFAKVHKEGQLRECKRIRARVLGGFGGEQDVLPLDRLAVVELVSLCREAVEAWLDDGAATGSHRLDARLTRLAATVDRLAAAPGRWVSAAAQRLEVTGLGAGPVGVDGGGPLS